MTERELVQQLATKDGCLERLATSDPNAKVRAQALYALTCRAAAG